VKAFRLTNSQIAARKKPNLNKQLADVLRASGYQVLDYKAWVKLVGEMTPARFEQSLSIPKFIAEHPFQPARTTWDYRKTATTFEKARWRFDRIPELRRWRWDFFAPALGIAIEVDGGGFVQGGHARGAQGCRDYLKRNEAEIDGIMVIKVDGTMLKHGVALDFIQRAIAARQDPSNRPTEARISPDLADGAQKPSLPSHSDPKRT
jgi:hypothetical protein